MKGAGEKFLIKADEKYGMLLFASDYNLMVAARSKHLVTDGTFKVAPIGFTQLLTLHAKVGLWGGVSPIVIFLS